MLGVSTELSRGVLHASDLRERLGVSPATLMRTVRAAGLDVVRIGRGRATHYALRQSWPNLDSSRFPLFRVTEAGRPVSAGELITLAARQSVWMPAGTVSNGLPIELLDARPSGFLGRHFATVHEDLRLPPRLADWSDHHTLIAMSQTGRGFAWQSHRWRGIVWPMAGAETVPRTRDDYPALADATTAGHPPGSSAGGERPKFGVAG